MNHRGSYFRGRGGGRPPNRGRPRLPIDGSQVYGTPSLASLHRDNRRKTRKFFRGHSEHRPSAPDNRAPVSNARTPNTVPRAPVNSNSFLMLAREYTPSRSLVSSQQERPQFHAITPNPLVPGTAWKNGFGTIDQEAAMLGEAAGIDFFGTNDGLITKKGGVVDDDVSDEDPDLEMHGFELHMDDEDDNTDRAAQARIEEQTAYINQLEEENMNLREKIYLFEQEARELQQDKKGLKEECQRLRSTLMERGWSEHADGSNKEAGSEPEEPLDCEA